MYFEIYTDASSEWRWQLKAANHEIVAQGEGYTTKQNCLHAVGLLMDTNRDTPVHEK